MSGGTQDAASSSIGFRLRGSHILWLRFPADSLNRQLVTLLMRSYNPQSASTWVWAVPISLAATFGISVIYFPPGTEMVHFPGLAHTRLCIQRAVARVHLAGFPHSEILGSKPACGSPRLIAACHVLHRLLAPRHSPYALSSLIIKLTQSVFAFRPRFPELAFRLLAFVAASLARHPLQQQGRPHRHRSNSDVLTVCGSIHLGSALLNLDRSHRHRT